MQSAEHVLEAMRKLGQAGQPLTRVYRQLFNRNLYLAAYAKLYRNEGALTNGTDAETIDGMSLERIDHIIEDIRHERFRFAPSRRIWIDKKNGQKRPLGIPNFRDKLVQEVLRGILEAYYEPQFSQNSHGFRPEKGCHTALKQIRQEFKAVTWFIEGDIKGCFDNVNHDRLMEILGTKIHDSRLLNLIRNSLQAGVMDGWIYERTHSGTPQGGVLSPLLSNIYLSELDHFISTVLEPKWNTGLTRKRNPHYRAYEYKIKEAAASKDHVALKRLLRERRKLPSHDVADPNFRRLHYVRYADDFLIGFTGTHDEAKHIKIELAKFLETNLRLQLSEQKTLITHARTRPATFLGYAISIHQHDNKMSKREGTNRRRRSINGSVRLGIPHGYITAKWRKYMQNGKSVHRAELLNHSIAEIIQQYQTEYRGVVNYYRYAEDVCHLNSLMWMMEQSLVKTLASKLKLSVKQVYYQYRQNIRIGDLNYKTLTVKVQTTNGEQSFVWGGIPLKRNKGQLTQPLEDAIHMYKWSNRSDLLTRILTNTCEVCGAVGQVEAHHIRRLKDLKKRWEGRPEPPEHVKRMIAFNRKTLIVCPSCHRNIHSYKKS